MTVPTQNETEGILLTQDFFEITYKDTSRRYPCTVLFNLRRGHSLVIEPLQSIHELCNFADVHGPFFVCIPGAKGPIECIVISSNMRQSGVFVKLMPRQSKIQISSNSKLNRVDAAIVNLGHYQGAGPQWISSFVLSHDEWVFEFTAVEERTLLYNPSIQDEDYLVTHHLCMRRENDLSFSAAEAHAELDDLSTFLSFCHGHWVSTTLAAGVDANGVVVMEEWGTGLLSSWTRGSNWLDEHHGTGMIELFPKFTKLVRSSDEWRKTIKQLIYWDVRSDTNLVGPDGSCILLQAALEHLAWQVLVRQKKSLSEDGFAKLPAADQLRLLLSTLSVPIGLPQDFTEVQALAKEFNWIDGPQAFVEIRNRLVHPPKNKNQNKRLPYYEAYLIGKWYLELAVLSSCGYTGVYSNRTHKMRSVGDVERVPWSS